MSKQTIDALNRWIAEWVRVVRRNSIPKEAERLATEFAAYATDAGIDLDRLEEEIEQDIVSRMEEALEEVADADDLLRDAE